jgi:nitrite reductase/ring-hydroxylating ferredoxin subunit/uncharacterized membrane protein
MRSRASYKSHPIHPALIPFPFAFLLGTVMFDVANLISGRQPFAATASHLNIVGIGAGLLAAVPGIIDYRFTVPPRSSGRQRATRHALGNTTALILFAIAWFSRNSDLTAAPASLFLEGAGAAVLAYSGWLGGTLVTRNLISVDHRYAGAGKWQEATIPAAPGERVVVAKKADLDEGQMKLLRVNDERIALARTADGFCAVQDRCTHRGGSLAGGVLVGRTVQCLWHGSQFDVTTGRVVCGPAKEEIRVYTTATHKEDVVLVSPSTARPAE